MQKAILGVTATIHNHEIVNSTDSHYQMWSNFCCSNNNENDRRIKDFKKRYYNKRTHFQVFDLDIYNIKNIKIEERVQKELNRQKLINL